MKEAKKMKADLRDTAEDKKQLKPDEAILNLPEVQDIEGQENVKIPPADEMGPDTISSDDEEGTTVFEDEDDVLTDEESNVSQAERQVLQQAASQTAGLEEEENVRNAKPDNTDEDGELLNEDLDADGSDLDVPGSEADDDNEEIGEEDEENNYYSLGDEERE